MRTISECSRIEVNRKIFREEEAKEICFQNTEYEIVCDVIEIEKCVFKKVAGGKRCDYLFLFDKKKQQYDFLGSKRSPAFYVELKGIGLAEACEQLFNSIEKTKDQLDDFDFNALVVSSRKFVPKYDNTDFYRELKRVIRKDVRFEITPCTIDL